MDVGFSFVHVSPVWGCKLLLHTLSSLMDGLLLLFQRVHALVWRRLYNIPGLPHLRLHSFVMLSHLAMKNYTNSCDSELVAAKLLITNTFMAVLRDKLFKQRKTKTRYSSYDLQILFYTIYWNFGQVLWTINFLMC